MSITRQQFWSSVAQGTLGRAVTAWTEKTRQSSRRYKKSTNKESVRRNAVLDLQRTLFDTWHQLDDTQRNAWIAWLSAVRWQLGRRRWTRSGILAYTRTNLYLLDAGRASQILPPQSTAVPIISDPVAGWWGNGTELRVSWTCLNDPTGDSLADVWISAPLISWSASPWHRTWRHRTYADVGANTVTVPQETDGLNHWCAIRAINKYGIVNNTWLLCQVHNRQ
jgi:hypothetical protein